MLILTLAILFFLAATIVFIVLLVREIIPIEAIAAPIVTMIIFGALVFKFDAIGEDDEDEDDTPVKRQIN